MADYTLQNTCAPWATVAQLLARKKNLQDIIPAPDESYLNEWLDIATDLLFTMSGRQFTGPCKAAYRPSGALTIPERVGTSFVQELDSNFWPVISVDKVTLDGAVLDPSTYVLEENRYLVKLPAAPDFLPNPWPRTQFHDRPLTEPGTWEVQITYGFAPPPLAVPATIDLAYEFMSTDLLKDSKLNERVKDIARAGISMGVVSPEDLINEDGKTGVYTVDFFLKTYNPKGLQSPSFVFSPDRQPNRRRWSAYPWAFDGHYPRGSSGYGTNGLDGV